MHFYWKNDFFSSLGKKAHTRPPFGDKRFTAIRCVCIYRCCLKGFDMCRLSRSGLDCYRRAGLVLLPGGFREDEKQLRRFLQRKARRSAHPRCRPLLLQQGDSSHYLFEEQLTTTIPTAITTLLIAAEPRGLGW